MGLGGTATGYENLVNKEVEQMEKYNRMPRQPSAIGNDAQWKVNLAEQQRWKDDPSSLKLDRTLYVRENLKTEGKTRDYNTTWVPDEQLIGRALLDPDEVRRLEDNRCLILLPGKVPLVQFRTIYYEHPLFEGTYRANPYFQKPAVAPHPSPEA